MHEIEVYYYMLQFDYFRDQEVSCRIRQGRKERKLHEIYRIFNSYIISSSSST